MKKTVLKFGLISGAILSSLMAISIATPLHDKIGWDNAEVAGYTTMVLAFLMVYFGVRSYRDHVAGGTIRFGRAFAVGALIAAVSSACYVATWEVYYYAVAPDFASKYQAHVLEKERAAGASAETLAQKKAEMEKFAELYTKNPAFNVAVTFLEPLPVALVMALISAGVLRRKQNGSGTGAALGAQVAA
jgi:hypothetical protein